MSTPTSLDIRISDYDKRMLDYFNIQLNNYIINSYLSQFDPLTSSSIIGTDSNKPKNDLKSYYNTFFNTDPSISVMIYGAQYAYYLKYLTWSKITDIKLIPVTGIINIALGAYGVSGTAIGFSYRYLYEQKIPVPYPSGLYPINPNSGTYTIQPVVLFSKIAPQIYLEMCTNMVHKFFQSMFVYIETDNTDSKNPKTIIIKQTPEDSNTWCFKLEQLVDNFSLLQNACGIEKNNIRCACQKCYTLHSFQSRQIYDAIDKAGVSNKDRWCYFPQCASGNAIKPFSSQQRSKCPNLSVSGIFVEPNENASVNISNTSVSTSSSDGGVINIIGGGCGDCKPDETCSVENNILTCKKNNNNSLKSLKIASSKKTKTYIYKWLWVLLFLGLSILFTIYIFATPKIKKNLLFGIIIYIILISIIISLNYYNQNKEKFYTFPTDYSQSNYCDQISTCYSDKDCGTTGQVCIDNECSCPYGKFYISTNRTCNDYPDDKNVKNINEYIVNNITNLPSTLYTGRYLYSVFINNILYVFSQNCTFKFDSKWIELSPNPYSNFKKGFTLWTNENTIEAPPFSTTNYGDRNWCYDDQQDIVYQLVYSSTSNNFTIYKYDVVNDTWSKKDIQNEKDGTFTFDPISCVFLNNNIYYYNNNKKYIYVLDIVSNQGSIKHIDSPPSCTILNLFIQNSILYMLCSDGSLYNYDNQKINKTKYAFKQFDKYITSHSSDGVLSVLNIQNSVLKYSRLYFGSGTVSNFPLFSQYSPKPAYDILYGGLYSISFDNNTKYYFIVNQFGNIARIYFLKDTSGTTLKYNNCFPLSIFSMPNNNKIIQL